MGYDWAYVIAEGAYEWMDFEPSPAPDLPLLPVSYDVDLWDDNDEHPRLRDVMRTTTDNRTYKAARLRTTFKPGTDDWSVNDAYCRNYRRMHGGRPHGTAQPVMFHDGHAPYMAQFARQPYGSWKAHRRHQWKGSAPV